MSLSLSLSPSTSVTSTIISTSVPLVERMGYSNWRAPPTEENQPNLDVDVNADGELDAVDPEADSCAPITIITTQLTISLSPSSTVVIPHTLTYTPTCSITGKLPIPTTGTNKTPTNDAPDNTSSDLPASSLRDPFYASTIPMAYSIAMTITLSYVLLFLLFLSTPRPWLQKVATLTVVICLTLALAETTTILALEYSLMGETWTADTESGSAKQIREKVVSGTEMRVGRIISDTFLWLAQVQTLIRLFPRHREKIVIKWAGFALIVLDTIFSILVHFLSPTTIMSPESFLDAIPALSYLFQIALSLLYACCVVYYSLSARIRRFAYYHPKAPSNLLIAILSLIAVLIPMVFFCLDIGQKDLAAWGDYVRWVGAAAASVVVWEWVDRIERLEREERREGVLGREIFDGDDGLVEVMSVSQDDDDQGPGHSKGSGGKTRGDPTRSITASGVLPEHADLTKTVVNRHSRHSVASNHHSDENGTVTGEPPVTYAAWQGVVGEPSSQTTTHPSSPITSRSASTSIEDPSQLERSATGPQSRTGSLIEEIGVLDQNPRTLDNQVKSEGGGRVIVSSSRVMPDLEKREAIQTTVGKSGKEDGSWFANALKLRQRNGSADAEGTSRSKWSSFKPKLPLSLPFIGALSAAFARDSAYDKTSKDTVATAGRQPLPVTVIPAPPRGLGVSLRELEEARRSGVGDENVRGVGVWTGNSLRNGTFSSNASEAQRRFSTSPGYGDSNEQSLQERLHQHQLQWNAQSYHDATIRQQQMVRSTSFTPLPTPSLPPLPPSPAVTATTSSWSASPYLYTQQQHPSYSRTPTSNTVSTAPDPTTPGSPGMPEISSPSSPRTPLAVMSGALPSSPADSSTLPMMARQGSSGGVGVGVGPSTVRPRSTTMSAGVSTGLGVVEETASLRGSLVSEPDRSTDKGKGGPPR